VYADIDGNQTSQTNDDTAASEQRSHEVVFVDAGVDNYQQLVEDLNNSADDSRHIEVVVLDRDKNGIEEISEYLAQYEDLDAVHIISHGDDGSLQLGNSELNADTLQYNNLKVALWANAFSETGDILIYGCNLAETEAGQNLLGEISALTLADVAASTDLTGHADLGGDWALEFSIGEIESKVAVSTELQRMVNERRVAAIEQRLGGEVATLESLGDFERLRDDLIVLSDLSPASKVLGAIRERLTAAIGREAIRASRSSRSAAASWYRSSGPAAAATATIAARSRGRPRRTPRGSGGPVARLRS